MIRHIVLWTVVILGIIFVFHDACFAQDDWEPVSAGPVSTWTAPLCGKGEFVSQLFLFYNHTRGTFDGEGNYNSLPKGEKKSQYLEQLFMQYGLTERLEIDVQTDYQQNYRRQNEDNAHSNEIGDSYFFLRGCLLEEKDFYPHITGLFQLKLPSGKYQKADSNKLGTDLTGATSGGGSHDLGYGILVTKKMRPFLWHADLIYSFPLETKVDGAKTQYARYLNYDFGIEYFLPKGFNAMFEFNGFLQGDKKENGDYVSNSDVGYLVISPGIGWSCDRFQTLLAYQRTVLGTNADANDSVVFTVVYTF